MYNKLLDMYQRNVIGEHELDNAILKGWITEEEKLSIMQSEVVSQ